MVVSGGGGVSGGGSSGLHTHHRMLPCQKQPGISLEPLLGGFHHHNLSTLGLTSQYMYGGGQPHSDHSIYLFYFFS